MDPTVFRRFYHEEVEEFDEDVAEPQYSDKRCDVSPEMSEKSIGGCQKYACESNLFLAFKNFKATDYKMPRRRTTRRKKKRGDEDEEEGEGEESPNHDEDQEEKRSFIIFGRQCTGPGLSQILACFCFFDHWPVSLNTDYEDRWPDASRI